MRVRIKKKSLLLFLGFLVVVIAGELLIYFWRPPKGQVNIRKEREEIEFLASSEVSGYDLYLKGNLKKLLNKHNIYQSYLKDGVVVLETAEQVHPEKIEIVLANNPGYYGRLVSIVGERRILVKAYSSEFDYANKLYRLKVYINKSLLDRDDAEKILNRYLLEGLYFISSLAGKDRISNSQEFSSALKESDLKIFAIRKSTSFIFKLSDFTLNLLIKPAFAQSCSGTRDCYVENSYITCSVAGGDCTGKNEGDICRNDQGDKGRCTIVTKCEYSHARNCQLNSNGDGCWAPQCGVTTCTPAGVPNANQANCTYTPPPPPTDTPAPTPTPYCDSSCGTCGVRLGNGSCGTDNTCCHRICSNNQCITVHDSTYGVQETNQCDNDTQCVPPTPTLAPPTNLTGSCTSPWGPADLSWTDSANEGGYRLARNVNNLGWNNDYDRIAKDTENYQVPQGEISYQAPVQYKVIACRPDEVQCTDTAESNVITVNCPTPTPTPPIATIDSCSVDPGTGSCSCTSDTQPTWSFSSNASSVTNFKVYRSGDFSYQGVIDCSASSVSCNLPAKSGSFTPAVPKSTGNYTLQVSAVNAGGEGPKSSPVSATIDTTAPVTDMACSFYSLGAGNTCYFRCQVSSATDNSCSQITEYYPSFRDSTGGFWEPGWKSFTADNPIYVYNVAPGATLYYKVRGRDGVGNTSNFSLEKSVYCPTQTSAPNVTCNTDTGEDCACTRDTTPTWNFTTTATDVVNFRVFRDWNTTVLDCADNPVVCQPDDTTSIKTSGSFTPSVAKTTGSYGVRVEAISSNDFSNSSAMSYANVDITAPSSPNVNSASFSFSCVYDSARGGYVVEVSWPASSDNGCGASNLTYWAQVSKTTDFALVIPGWGSNNTWLSGTTRSAVSTGVTQGERLYARIKARDALDNQSSWSLIKDTVCIGGPSTPLPPTPTPTPVINPPTPTPTSVPTPTPTPIDCNTYTCTSDADCQQAGCASVCYNNTCVNPPSVNTLNGFVFLDNNSNNVYDVGVDTPVGGVTLEITCLRNGWDQSSPCTWLSGQTTYYTSYQNTNNFGYWQLAGGLGFRTYKVRLSNYTTVPSGWQPVYTEKDVSFNNWSGETIAVNFPFQPIPSPGPWIRIKDASFQSISKDFVVSVPSNAEHFDLEDDSDGPYFSIGEEGVVTVENLIGVEAGKPMMMDETKRRLSRSGRIKVGYSYLNYAPEFPDISLFVDYIKSNKKVITNLKPDVVGNIVVQTRGLYLIENPSTTIIPADPPDTDYMLVVKGEVRIKADDGEFNVALGDQPARSIIVIADTITFDPNLTKAYGVFIGNVINMPASNLGLKIKGNLITLKQFNFSRDLGMNTKPAVFIIFDIKPYLDLREYISISKIEYNQIKK